MVIKTPRPYSGWSYSNGDDQYDNDSLGSTQNAKIPRKLVKISTKTDQNEQVVVMCSNYNSKHTDDQGWTTIDANSNRKPKSETNQHSTIDSIITSIDIDLEIIKNGSTEAKIDSPVRENRCTIPDATYKQKEITFDLTRQSQRMLITPKVEETVEEEADVEKETETQTLPRETKKNNKYTQQIKQVRFGGEERSNAKMSTTHGEERKTEVRTTIDRKINGEIGITTMATNGPSEGNHQDSIINKTNDSNEGHQQNEANNSNSNNTYNNNDDNSSNRNNNNGGNNKQRVNIVVPGEMDTYAFTISWRPDQKEGQDGKIIIKMLMREMAHRTPSIVFHPTNSASSPVPRDINNINNDFPKTPASFDDFFDVMRNRDNTNQRTFMKVTMPHDEKELQKKLSNYLFYNKLYMNSPFIDDNTLEHVGFIENGHSRLVYRPNLEIKIRKGLKEVMEGDQLTPQQVAQLKHLSSPIRVECQRGTIRAGPSHQQIVCEGIVLKTAKSQSKIAMELLSMLPESILGAHYRIIPKSLNNLLGYEIYGQIVADTVNFQDKLRPITIMHCHPTVFEDMYDGVKHQNSKHVEVHRFIIENCGAISIEETSETNDKGKYIVVVPEEKVESARTAIGKMFQEFQQSEGRPASLACLKAYQNYPLVNDNVTIFGHAQKLSDRIRSRYQNRPKTPLKQSSSASYSYHGSTAEMQVQNQLQATAIPRSIVKPRKQLNNGSPQQWQASPRIQRQHQQQQRTTTTTNQHVEDRTVMSNLSPDDSAKTMMTNVSRMVDTLGSAVNTLARESANTNDTMKQMMIQQTTTMNNLMLILARNEERRQDVPANIIQQTSTPANSTITNSQQSQSQYSTSANKRKIGGIADDDTTAVSTVANGTYQMEEDDNIDDMLEDQEDAMEELEAEAAEELQHNNNNNMATEDVTMTDQKTTEQQEATTGSTITTAVAEGNFDHQFGNKAKSNDTDNNNAPLSGVNQQ
jgi:hypothetical protein